MSLSDHKNIIKTIHPGSLWAGYKYIEQIFYMADPEKWCSTCSHPPPRGREGNMSALHCHLSSAWRKQQQLSARCRASRSARQFPIIFCWCLIYLRYCGIELEKGRVGCRPYMFLQMFINHRNMFLRCYYEQYERQQLTLVPWGGEYRLHRL